MTDSSMQSSASAENLKVQLITKPGSPLTGIGRYAFELARGLQSAGVDLRQAELKTPIPASVSRLTQRVGYDLETFSHSYPFRADVRSGYITHLTSQTLATLLITQRLPRPVVVTVHDILPYLLRDDPELSVYRHRMDRMIDALAMRGLCRADRLIADSHYTKQTIIDVLHIPADRIDVVHLGVDTTRFKPQSVPNEFRLQYDVPCDRKFVLFVGSEDPRKDLPTLLRAVAQIRREVPNVVLLKVGAAAFAEQRAHHLQLCNELGIDGIVRWFDSVPEEDLPLFYNVADVFAFPSRYEGFGFPVLEAMACGIPTVATDASAIAEISTDAIVLTKAKDVTAWASALRDILIKGVYPAYVLENRMTIAKYFSWFRTIQQTVINYRVLDTGHHQ